MVVQLVGTGDLVETCSDVRTCPLEREPLDPVRADTSPATA
jgi:hypothetical protein